MITDEKALAYVEHHGIVRPSELAQEYGLTDLVAINVLEGLRKQDLVKGVGKRGKRSYPQYAPNRRGIDHGGYGGAA